MSKFDSTKGFVNAGPAVGKEGTGSDGKNKNHTVLNATEKPKLNGFQGFVPDGPATGKNHEDIGHGKKHIKK